MKELGYSNLRILLYNNSHVCDGIVIFAGMEIDELVLIKFTVNKIKTKLVVFKRGRLDVKLLDIKFEGSLVEIVSKFVFLGMSFSNTIVF